MTRTPPDRFRVIRYIAMGALEGVIAGWVVLFLLMWLDIAGIGRLISSVDGGQIVFILAVVMFAITFGSVGIAWRVMVTLPQEDGEDDE